MASSEPDRAPTRTFTMNSPLFGPCRLLPHELDEQPEELIGYVAFQDEPDNLVLAIRRNDEWVGRNMKKFGRPIARWYSVEKADGSPLF